MELRRVLLVTLWLVLIVGALYIWFARPDLVRRSLSDASSTSVFVGYALYLLLGSLRGFTLLPATTLVLAAMAFVAPVPLFVLTLAGILISSASIYGFSEALHLRELLEQRHQATVERLRDLLSRHEMPIIVAWSFFPLAPTDLIVYVCGVLEVNFWKCLAGVAIGEGAICAIYIFAGDAVLRWLSWR